MYSESYLNDYLSELTRREEIAEELEEELAEMGDDEIADTFNRKFNDTAYMLTHDELEDWLEDDGSKLEDFNINNEETGDYIVIYHLGCNGRPSLKYGNAYDLAVDFDLVSKL